MPVERIGTVALATGRELQGRDLEAAVRRSPLLFDLPPNTLEWFVRTAEVREVAADGVVFRLGEVGRELFLVASGEIEIVVPAKPGREEVLACLGPGAWFGEIAVLTGEGRSATARASRDSVLIAVDRDALRQLASFAPVVALRLSDGLSRRLRETTLRRHAPNRPSIVIVEGESTSDADREAPVALAHEIAEELGTDVVLFAGGPPTVVGRRVHRRGRASSAGDVVAATLHGGVAVVRVNDHDPATEAIRALPAACVTLGEVAAATAASLGGAPTALVTTPLRRLARRLLGRTVALVLGAGGAKGFCHIGAIRAFERAGIRFDLIVGTSIGALIGGFAARPASGDEIYEGFRDVARDVRRLCVDVRLLGPSLLRGRKKTAILARHTLGRNLEDLPVPFRAVAADLAMARETTLATGPLAQAMDAATAFPTVFPPIARGPQQLVDGWMVNPLPADVAVAEGASRIIAIDPCAAGHATMPRLENPARPGGLVRRITGGFDVGARFRIAMLAFDVSSRDRAASARALTDVCLEPALAGYTSTDLHAYDRIVELGAQAASESLGVIRRALDRYGREES